MIKQKLTVTITKMISITRITLIADVACFTDLCFDFSSSELAVGQIGLGRL